ncbi:2OG-Fe(II) oxygenase [Dapis sp. BLCC M229]|uniref:2OG-Fe(II) oxygenase n=1 Tax=Dapis sp. BLCC M229 TaxID=3400188 RepID=UPI003CF18934|nr:2OG-Fe(II) oxygenase [Trichodesmium sp. MO_231.B1]
MLLKIKKKFTDISSDFNYQAETFKYARNLPYLSSYDQEIVRQLKQEGIFITSLKEFDTSLNSKLMEGARKLLPSLQTISSEATNNKNIRAAGSHCIYGSSTIIARDYPEIFMWGLEERIFNILENYYSVPVRCIGINFRRDIANEKQTGTRFWHLDGEDRKVVKICIYLNDVDENGGPFEYIPKSLTPSYRSFKDINYKIVDEEMEKIVPSSKWKSCQGSAGTIIIADNAKIFHHGKIPLKDRYTLFYVYVSHNPKKPAMCKHSSWREGLPILLPNLSIEQKERIWNYQDIVVN